METEEKYLLVFRGPLAHALKRRFICFRTYPASDIPEKGTADPAYFVEKARHFMEAGYRLSLQFADDEENCMYPLHPEDEKFIREQLGLQD